MKKFYLFLLACFITVTGAQAHSATFTPKQLSDARAFIERVAAAAKNNSTLHKTAGMRTSNIATVPDSAYIWPWSADTYAWSDTISGRYYFWSADGTHIDSSLAQYQSSGVYVDADKIIETYDGHGNMLTELEMESNGSSLQPAFLVTYTYDGHNNVLTHAAQTWGGASFSNYSYETKFYDGNNNLLNDTSLYWDGSAYSSGSVDVYSYDGNNNMLTDTGFALSNFIYTYSFVNTFAYDSHNNRLSLTPLVWYGSAFHSAGLETYSYDSNNNLISDYNNGSNGVGINSYRDTLTYDGNNNELSDIDQSWNGAPDYVNYEETLMSYDANNNQTSRSLILWDGGAWTVYEAESKALFDGSNRQLMEVQESFNTAGDSIADTYSDSALYYYGGLTTAVHAYSTPGAQVYPNPASNNLTIATAGALSGNTILKVFDDAGRLVLQKSILTPAAQINLNIAWLHSGVYHLELQSQQGSMVQQFIKE